MNEITSIRTAIQAIVAATPLVDSTTRYRGDEWEIDSKLYPSVMTFFESDEVEYLSIGSTRTLEHVCAWRVEIVTQNHEQLGSAVEAQTWLDASVNALVAAITDRTLGGIVRDTQLTGFEYQFNSEGERTVGSAIVRLQTSHTTTKTD